jgi:hypothetical protein
MLPEIVDVKALGSYVHVEVLSTQEVLRTKLTLTTNANVPVNEAYVLDVGPQVPAEYGLNVGDRVFIDGGITFDPNYQDYKWDKDGRKRGMVTYSSIKGRSIEGSAIELA